MVLVLVLTALLAILAAGQMRTLAAGQQLAWHAKRGEQTLQMAQWALRQCEQQALQGGAASEPTDPPRWSSLARWTASAEVQTITLPSTSGASEFAAQCLVEGLVLWKANPPPHCTPGPITPCPAGTLPPWSRLPDAGRTITVRATDSASGSAGASGTWVQSTLMLTASAPVSSEPWRLTQRSWRVLQPR